MLSTRSDCAAVDSTLIKLKLFQPHAGHTCQPNQAMIEKIVKLQRQLARRTEKIEFLEEHVRQCVDELKKKTKYVPTSGVHQRWGTWGVQGVQNVLRSAWVKTDAATKTANATSVQTHTLAASVFTHALQGTF